MNMGIMASPSAIFDAFAGVGRAVTSAASAVWTHVSAGASRLFSCFSSAPRDGVLLESRRAAVDSVADKPVAVQPQGAASVRVHAPPSAEDPVSSASTGLHIHRPKDPGHVSSARFQSGLDSKHAPGSAGAEPRFDEVMRDKPWVPSTRAQAIDYAEKWISSRSVDDLSKIKAMRGNAAGELAVSRFVGAEAAELLGGVVETMLTKVSEHPRRAEMSTMELEAAAGRAFTEVLRDLGASLPASVKGLLRDVAALIRSKGVQDLAGLSAEQRVVANVLVLKALGKVLNDRFESARAQATKDACKILMRVSTTLCESGDFKSAEKRPFNETQARVFEANHKALKVAMAGMGMEVLQMTDRLLDF